MRYVYIFVFAAILTINFTGCNNDTARSSLTSTVVITETSADESTDDSSASVTVSGDAQDEVTVKASYEKPQSLEEKDTIILEGLLKGEEYIEVIIIGEVFDFEQISLSWDESKNELQEKEVIKKIDKLENKTLVIKTYQPEGIPKEKIKWKSKTGKAYEYIISEKSLGETDNSITRFEMD